METENENSLQSFSHEIGEKEKRKLKAKRQDMKSVWSGFGLFGMIGWSVVVPSLAGTALGMWLDKKYPQSFSWTLSCLITGLITGCLIAWRWVAKENKEIHQNQENNE
jgi:ATP synthase protein I